MTVNEHLETCATLSDPSRACACRHCLGCGDAITPRFEHTGFCGNCYGTTDAQLSANFTDDDLDTIDAIVWELIESNRSSGLSDHSSHSTPLWKVRRRVDEIRANRARLAAEAAAEVRGWNAAIDAATSTVLAATIYASPLASYVRALRKPVSDK